jgi:hypothetical protein
MKKPRRIFRERRKSDYVRVTPPKGKHYDPNDVWFIAMHEAGHAVSAIVLGYNLKSVDLNERMLPNGQVSVGFTDSGKVQVDEVRGKGEAAALPHMIQCVTGPIAESMVNPGFMEYGGHRDDFENARRVAAVALCNAIENAGRMENSSEELKRVETRLDALCEAAVKDAFRLVEDYVVAIVRVTELLAARKYLSGDEVAAIVHELCPQGGSRRPAWPTVSLPMATR